MPFLCCAVNAVNTLCFLKKNFLLEIPKLYSLLFTQRLGNLFALHFQNLQKHVCIRFFFLPLQIVFEILKKNSLNLSMHVSKPMIWKILKIYKCLTKNDAKPRSNSLRNDECVCVFLFELGGHLSRKSSSFPRLGS